MAQTSGNRDEPSMEDILSSIRKIIQSNEDKDDVTDEQKAVPQPPASAPVAAAVEKAEPKLVVKPVEQSAEPAQIKVSKPADVAVPVNVPASVNAEVQSERGELTDAPARAPQAAVQAITQPTEVITEVKTPAQVTPAAVVETPVAVEAPAPIVAAPVAPVAQAPMPKADQIPSLAAQVVASAQEVGVEHVAAALEGELNSSKAEEVTAPVETRNSVPALLSSGSGAKVAASFAELAETLEEQTNQNLEGMAGDMLRPMLQEWLDDNLPSLVERLVREEIERVARGG